MNNLKNIIEFSLKGGNMRSIQEIRSFLKLHYKEDRFINTKEYKNRELYKVNDAMNDFKIYGYSIITHQSSKTSETIIFNSDLEILKRTKGKTLNISYLV
jgi:hypothetical protein